MLQWMRGAQTWMIKGVLWAVVLTFVVTIFYQWGVQTGGSGPTRSEVATIFGQPVSLREFQRLYNGLQQRYRAMLRLQEQDLDRFNFREMALEQLATRAILLRMAQEYSVTVTPQELYDHIAAVPAFQDAGRFATARYEAVLRSQVPPMSPRQFETEQQQDLLIQKVSSLLGTGMQVTEAEVTQTYQREHAQVALRYVNLGTALFEAEVTPSEEDVQKHYTSYKDTYREPEQRQIRYATVPLQRFQQHYEPTAEEVNDYYAQHLDTFRRPEQVRARHILLKVPAGATPEQEAQARTRADALLAELQQGANFDALATQHSEDTASAAQGGDLGYFPRNQMVKPFEEVAFTLPPGQVSAPVKTQFGWHILRVEDKREEAVKPLEEAAVEVKEKLRETKARDAATTFTDDLMATLEANPRQWVELAQQHDLALVTTPFVRATDRVPGLEALGDLVRRVFTLPELGVETLQGPDGTWYVFQNAAIQPSTLQELDTVRERVIQEVRVRHSQELARKQVETWATEAQAGTALAELAAQRGVTVVETGLFKAKDPIPQLGYLQDVKRVVAGLRVNEVGTASDGGRHLVLQVVERQPADMQAYEKEKKEYQKKLLEQKRQQASLGLQQYLRTQYQILRQQGDIVVNPQYIF